MKSKKLLLSILTLLSIIIIFVFILDKDVDSKDVNCEVTYNEDSYGNYTLTKKVFINIDDIYLQDAYIEPSIYAYMDKSHIKTLEIDHISANNIRLDDTEIKRIDNNSYLISFKFTGEDSISNTYSDTCIMKVSYNDKIKEWYCTTY